MEAKNCEEILDLVIVEEKDCDQILDLTIQYVQDIVYPPDLSREKKRSVCKQAAKLVVEKGEVFLTQRKRERCV